MKIEILTRCTRPENLLRVKESILSSGSRNLYEWKIIFDTSVVSYVESKVLSAVSSFETYFWEGQKGDMSHGLLNRAIDMVHEDSWIYVLDDDNELHPDFFREIQRANEENPSARGFIFSQNVGGKDFTGLQVREASPDNVKVQKIDMAQFVLQKSLVGPKRFEPMKYVADGIFIQELFEERPDDFVFIPKILCNYNSLDVPGPNMTLPRVLLLGSDEVLRSDKAFDFESDALCMSYASNDSVREVVAKFDPDCIVTTGESYEPYSSLGLLPYDFRQRWVHQPVLSGEAAYQCATNYMLQGDYSDLVSIFTPVYNTKEKIFRTYQSVCNQTYSNWEWVVVNDSTDNETLKLIDSIAKNDPRVKVYDFREKSRGIIGEVKYRACCLSKGRYLLELDHDDYLLPHALEKTVSAFLKYPDAGFVYSDCAEIFENFESAKYGEGFCFGYGYYRDEVHLGRTFAVANTANINPITIRHIVGVPNHLRAWRRDVYFKIGGHNRRLSIADDYELIVRTFLETKFVKIPMCCYLQFFHGGNSQDSSRADIQRRVRSISTFYTERIKKRFEELGKEDWAYMQGSLPWNVPSRMGEAENYVNYILEV